VQDQVSRFFEYEPNSIPRLNYKYRNKINPILLSFAKEMPYKRFKYHSVAQLEYSLSNRFFGAVMPRNTVITFL
jgi:hypothetical protein